MAEEEIVNKRNNRSPRKYCRATAKQNQRRELYSTCIRNVMQDVDDAGREKG